MQKLNSFGVEKFSKINLFSVDSTNIFAKEYIKSVNTKKNICIRANNQTAGKGQTGSAWLSEPDKNLTFSLIIFPENISPSNQFYISKAISCAIIRVFDDIDSNFQIKWPNDIYFKDKKIGGILIENAIAGQKIVNTVIGIGLNINQTQFNDILPNPTSLKLIKAKDFDIDDVLDKILFEFENMLNTLYSNKFETFDLLYFNKLYRYNEFCLYKDKDGSFEAMILGTENSGRLVVTLKTGEIKKYDFKEIVFL